MVPATLDRCAGLMDQLLMRPFDTEERAAGSVKFTQVAMALGRVRSRAASGLHMPSARWPLICPTTRETVYEMW